MAVFTQVINHLQFQIPLLIVLCSISLYLLTNLVVQYFKTWNSSGKVLLSEKLGQAEKGDVVRQQKLADGDRFELEKRAFLSKTWLFVCHRSRFDKIGSYHTFSIAGISFFIVLSKDGKLRAFHNVCRHRAYTVVRKACGTSTRFSCKYHGWQYDDQGKLVKAPQFDQSQGFDPEQNGLYEVKLLLAEEGMIFVNFDASIPGVPFRVVRSKLDIGDCKWIEGYDIALQTNWKNIASDFADQAQWSQSALGWLSALRKPNKITRLLGPLSILRELDDQLWFTLSLLPVSDGETNIRCDVYGGECAPTQQAVIDKWKLLIRKELDAVNRASPSAAFASLASFVYECGGRTIDLSAILSQHQRSEKLAKERLKPAIQISSEEDVDKEASAICDALDDIKIEKLEDGCSKLGRMARRLDW